jgi:hypothetical protein
VVYPSKDLVTTTVGRAAFILEVPPCPSAFRDNSVYDVHSQGGHERDLFCNKKWRPFLASILNGICMSYIHTRHKGPWALIFSIN